MADKARSGIYIRVGLKDADKVNGFFKNVTQTLRTFNQESSKGFSLFSRQTEQISKNFQEVSQNIGVI